MKILVLMPLDERSSYMAMGIYNALAHEIREKTFCMPAFMEGLVVSKMAPNGSYAVFDTLLTAQRVYDAAGDDDLLVIGNTNINNKFDVVFNFQDIEEDLEYKDVFVDKLKDVVAGEETLEKLINTLHKASESKMALHNCTATADFLSSYIKTDPHLEIIEQEYQDALKELKHGKNH